MFDFEFIDIESARAEHERLPPGILESRYLQPGYWEQRRRALQATDRALTGASLDWLMQLPPALRPKALCDRFPRVVNSISDSWAETAKSQTLFDQLLNDPRPGRRGFPADARRELELLRAHRATLA